MTSEARAEYARLRALVDVRLEALRGALDEHERNGQWGDREILEQVEAGLAALAKEVAGT